MQTYLFECAFQNDFAHKSVLVRQGQRADRLGLIVRGECRVYRRTGPAGSSLGTKIGVPSVTMPTSSLSAVVTAKAGAAVVAEALGVQATPPPQSSGASFVAAAGLGTVGARGIQPSSDAALAAAAASMVSGLRRAAQADSTTAGAGDGEKSTTGSTRAQAGLVLNRVPDHLRAAPRTDVGLNIGGGGASGNVVEVALLGRHQVHTARQLCSCRSVRAYSFVFPAQPVGAVGALAALNVNARVTYETTTVASGSVSVLFIKRSDVLRVLPLHARRALARYAPVSLPTVAATKSLHLLGSFSTPCQ